MATNSQGMVEGELDSIEQMFLEDALFDAEFQSAIENIPGESSSFQCLMCTKICLSRGGLKRHNSAKHPETAAAKTTSPQLSSEASSSRITIPNRKCAENILHPILFRKMVQTSINKLKKDECYPPTILNELSKYTIDSVEDVFPCYHRISSTILTFNGDSEKFYPDFYTIVSSNDVFPGLANECKLLLGFELANHVLAHLTGGTVTNEVVDFSQTEVDEKQKAIIAYVSGYVIGKLFRKLRFSKNKNIYQEQYLSILEACKYIEGSETDSRHQKLVDLKNRGGLWKINSDVVAIFSIAESYFVSITKNFVSKIDASKIVSVLLDNTILIAFYSSIRRRSELLVKKEIALNLLADMLALYIRIRAHSYARNKQQEHKVNKDATKTKSLRTERKRATPSMDSGH